MGFIVGDEDRPPAGDDALIEVVRLHGLRRWPRAQHGGHDVRLTVVLGCVVAFVKLLDVGEVDRTLRAGALSVPAHVGFHIPIQLQLRRDDRVCPEDAATAKVELEPLEHDHVGRDDQAGLGVLGVVLQHRVEVLPGDSKAHHLGLAAAGRHLEAVAGEIVVLEQPELAAQCGR